MVKRAMLVAGLVMLGGLLSMQLFATHGVTWGIVGLTALVAVAGVIISELGGLIQLYFMLLLSDATVPFGDLLHLRMGKCSPKELAFARIRASKAGIDLSLRQCEAFVLEGGRLGEVVSAMISARWAGMPLTWEQATAHDLAGRDCRAMVQQWVRKHKPPTGDARQP